MSPRSEKEEMLNALSKRIFSAMVDEIILDAALQAHHEVLRGKAVCHVCRTRCGSVHLPGSLSQTSGGAAGPSSRADTPSSTSATEAGKAVGSNGSVNGAMTPNTAGTGTPTGGKDGATLLDCVVCQRQIASNRFAPHLSACMGLTSTRRGSARTGLGPGGKPKLPSDAGRSASPVSETGNGSDGKGKGKAKSKRPGEPIHSVPGNGFESALPQAEENEGSLKRKRPGSPQTSPTKVTKKAKASGSPVSRVKAEPDSTGPLTSSHFATSTAGSKSKIPSKLRESSTTSFLDRSPSAGSSRESSPAAATPGSSSFSAATQSPSISARGISNGMNRGRGKATGTGPPTRRVMSPPRPPPPMVHHVSIVSDYGMNDGGDETGSSTDTDSE